MLLAFCVIFNISQSNPLDLNICIHTASFVWQYVKFDCLLVNCISYKYKVMFAVIGTEEAMGRHSSWPGGGSKGFPN